VAALFALALFGGCGQGKPAPISSAPKSLTLLDGHLKAGNEFHRNQEYDKAVQEFSKALQLDPDNATLYVRRAMAYDASWEIDRAIQDYTHGIRLAPSDKFYVLRAVSHMKKRDNDEAIRDCTEALRLNPRSPAARTTRGMGYADKGYYKQAILDYTQAMDHDANYSLALEKFAWLLATCPRAEFRDGRKALEYATKACDLSDRHDAHNLETVAAAYAENGHFDKAVEWQEKAMANQHYREEELREARMRLQLYKASKPYRELIRSTDPLGK
jgi:tetratricopeptide (TPR) repeat protein